MKQPKLTIKEQFVLDSLEFHTYDDHVSQAVRKWNISNNEWIERIREAQVAITAEQFREIEAELDRAQDEYTGDFAEAFNVVAADGKVPELTIPALVGLLQHDEKMRCEKLRRLYTRFDIDEASDEYIKLIAQSFGDPDGATLYHDSPPHIHNDYAVALYAQRLEAQASLILEPLSQKWGRVESHHQRDRKIATFALRVWVRFDKWRSDDI